MMSSRAQETSHRSRLEIYLDVLRTIYDGAHKPTHIMSRANISWRPLLSILGSLARQGLIREVDVSGDRDGRTNRSYEITERGRNAVRYFGNARELQELAEAATERARSRIPHTN